MNIKPFQACQDPQLHHRAHPVRGVDRLPEPALRPHLHQEQAQALRRNDPLPGMDRTDGLTLSIYVLLLFCFNQFNPFHLNMGSQT